MRLACDVEVTYTLAVTNGGASSKGTRSRASLTLGKKPTGSGPKKGKEEEMYMLVSTVKNVTGTSYKVCLNNIMVNNMCSTIMLGKGQHHPHIWEVPKGRKGDHQVQRTSSRSSHQQGVTMAPFTRRRFQTKTQTFVSV